LDSNFQHPLHHCRKVCLNRNPSSPGRLQFPIPTASLQESLWLGQHPSVQVMNVDLYWDGNLQTLDQTIYENSNSLDFPALENTLGDCRQPISVASQATINRLVRSKASNSPIIGASLSHFWSYASVVRAVLRRVGEGGSSLNTWREVSNWENFRLLL